MPKLDALGSVAKNMHETLEFYRTLGLEIPADAEAQDHVEFVTPAGLRLMWDTEAMIKGMDPAWQPPASSRISLAFLCENPADVDVTYQRLVGKGYHSHKAPWDAFWGQRYAQVLDPDGNSVDLFAPL